MNSSEVGAADERVAGPGMRAATPLAHRSAMSTAEIKARIEAMFEDRPRR
ncbi:hypothetical protein [Rhodococcus sp. NPDC003348]